ncbi:MAG TPA: tetratricopeptide repeat protein [Candidatus Methylomirabilis sp.]|nr:tetratricopeptide repeat protein [Candidatus Methylomirabilis sp.]
MNQRAVALTNQSRYEEAAALFSQALGLSPNDEVIRRNFSGLRTRWGHELMGARSLDQAEAQYRGALELNPNESAALLGLGDVQLGRREPRMAAETYRQAIAMDPRNADAYIRLGEAYYHQGSLTAALSEWERGLNLRPGDARLRARIQQVEKEARVQGGYRARASQHFTVVFEGQRREDIGRELLQILERAYADIGYELGAYPPYEVQVFFYSDADFWGATGVPAALVGGGFYHTLDGKIRIALKGLASGDPWLNSVLYHEYTHALVYAITHGNNPPRWVHEGLAVHMERQRAPELKREAVREARAGVVPALDQSPYTHGSVAIGYLIDRYGLIGIQQMLRRMGEGLGFGPAFQEAFRMDVATLQQNLRDLLVRGY